MYYSGAEFLGFCSQPSQVYFATENTCAHPDAYPNELPLCGLGNTQLRFHSSALQFILQ